MRINYVFKVISVGFFVCSLCGCRFNLCDGSLEIGQLSAETKIKE